MEAPAADQAQPAAAAEAAATELTIESTEAAAAAEAAATEAAAAAAAVAASIQLAVESMWQSPAASELLLAAHGGSLATVQQQLQNNPDALQCDMNGWGSTTVLHCAVGRAARQQCGRCCKLTVAPMWLMQGTARRCCWQQQQTMQRQQQR